MANHNLPQTTSTYVNFVSELDGRFDDLSVGLDPAVTTATNVPTNSIRWNSALRYWEKYNGTTWGALSTSFSININGSVGATTASTGAFTTLSSSSTTALASGTTIGGNAAVTVSDTQTLTNKTLTTPVISTITNTGTITLPTTTDTLVGRATTDTLTNKTLTAPRFADLGFIADASGNEILEFDSNASAVNYIAVTNSATAVKPTLAARGGDTNISLDLVSKGTGTVQVNGVDIDTVSGTQTLTNKTLTTPVLSGTASGTTAGRLGYLSGAFTYGNGAVQRTVVNTDEAQTLTNKTLSTSSVWNGNTIGVTYGGTGTTTAPSQGGIIFGNSTTAYASTAAGTAGQVLQSNGASAPTWASFDLSIHAPDSSYKKIVRLATTADLEASTFASNVLTGYPNAKTLASTTTAASTTITTSGSTADLKVGAAVSTATIQVAAGTTVASISNATTFTVNNRAAITTTGITGTGTTATATFAAQTYAPYAVGSVIVISGATPAGYNGSFTVTACTTTSVSWASAQTGTATVQGAINFTIAAGSPSLVFAQTIAALSVDGVAVALNDRVLVKDQRSLGGLIVTDAPKYNGVYTVTAIGSTTVPWTLTRSVDADLSGDLDSAIVNVSVGTINSGKTFQTYFTGTSTLNTTVMLWNRIVDANASSFIPTPTTTTGINIAIPSTTTMTVAGAVAHLASNSLGVETLQSTSASTYTNASTLYIAGAPVASTNVTITSPWSLYVASGATYLNSTVVGGVLQITGTGISAGSFNASATTPTNTTRLNYEGNFYTTNLNLLGAADTATAATHYFVETGSDGFVRPKTLANTQAEIVTTATVSATTLTAGSASTGALKYNGTTAAAGQLDGGTTTPTGLTRLNYGGNFYTTNLNLIGAADTATAASHYYVETASDGFVRPKLLANVQSEIVTTAAVNTAAATTVGTITTGVWNATDVSLAAGGTNASLTALNGGIVYSTASAMAISAAGTSGQVLLSGGAGVPTWGTVALTAGGTGATTQLAALQNLGAIAAQTVAKTAAYTVVVGDRGDVILCSGTFSVSLTAAATLANGFSVGIINTGTGTITIDPNSTETIDGAATKVLTPGQSCIIITDGTSWRTLGLSGGGATGGGADQIFYENGQAVTTNYTVATGKNAMTAGPITINSGITVTVSSGSVWTVV